MMETLTERILLSPNYTFVLNEEFSLAHIRINAFEDKIEGFIIKTQVDEKDLELTEISQKKLFEIKIKGKYLKDPELKIVNYNNIFTFGVSFVNPKREELNRYGTKHQENLRKLLELYNEFKKEEEKEILYEDIKNFDYAFGIWYGSGGNGGSENISSAHFQIDKRNLYHCYIFVRDIEEMDVVIIDVRELVEREFGIGKR